MTEYKANNKASAPLSLSLIPSQPSVFNAEEDEIQAAAAILNAMSSSPDKADTHQDRQTRTLGHAVAPRSPPVIKFDTSSTLSINIYATDQGGQQSAASKSDDTTKARARATSYMTSDAQVTTEEIQRGIIERVMVTPERTILAGRTETSDRQREKQPAGQIGQAVTNENGKDSCGTQGGIPEGNGSPSQKLLMAPLEGIQAGAAQQYTKTISGAESSRHNAGEAESHMAHGHSRTVTPTALVPELDYAVWDGSEVVAAAQNIRRSSIVLSQQPYDAANSAPHATFRPVYIHTSKCDICDRRNQSVLQRCDSCTKQMCHGCMTKDTLHSAEGLDWANHGAQSASKPRTYTGPRKNAVSKAKPNPHPRRRAPIQEERFEEQMGLIEQSRHRSSMQPFANPNNPTDANISGERRAAPARTRSVVGAVISSPVTPEGRARQAGRGRRVVKGIDGAADEGEVMYMGERPTTDVPRKRVREPAAFNVSPSREFRPIGASAPYTGSGNFQAPQISQQEVLHSVYGRHEKPNAAQTEKERAVKKHKGPVPKGTALSKERISKEDEDEGNESMNRTRMESRGSLKKRKGPVPKVTALSKERISREDEDEDNASEDDVPMMNSRASQRPALSFGTGGQAQTRTPAWSLAHQTTQSGPAQDPQSARSVSTPVMRPDVNTFFAEANQLQEEYMGVMNELANAEEKTTQLREKMSSIEAKISKRMGN